jgi:hypothetical protein
MGETRTLAAMDSLEDIVDLVLSRPDVFIRYSADPWQDISSTSYDYEADVELPGVSVTVIRPEPWWTRPAIDWVARRVCKYLDLAQKERSRRPWLLTGRVVGSGPDHEPLVSEIEPIAWISETALKQAKELYHTRFKVGRDSADH